MKKLILFACLLFFQSLLPSDFGLHRAQLAKALLVTAGTAAVGVGGYYLNKRGEERYKAALAKPSTVNTPPQISFGWRIARNLLTVLCCADKVNDTGKPPRSYRAWSCIPGFQSIALKTGLTDILSKPATGLSPHITSNTTPTELQDPLITRWAPHAKLLSFLTNYDYPKRDQFLSTAFESLPLINDPENQEFVNLFATKEQGSNLFYLKDIIKSPYTTGFIDASHYNCNCKNIFLVMYKNKLYKFHFATRPFVQSLTENIQKRLDSKHLMDILAKLKK